MASMVQSALLNTANLFCICIVRVKCFLVRIFWLIHIAYLHLVSLRNADLYLFAPLHLQNEANYLQNLHHGTKALARPIFTDVVGHLARSVLVSAQFKSPRLSTLVYTNRFTRDAIN